MILKIILKIHQLCFINNPSLIVFPICLFPICFFRFVLCFQFVFLHSSSILNIYYLKKKYHVVFVFNCYILSFLLYLSLYIAKLPFLLLLFFFLAFLLLLFFVHYSAAAFAAAASAVVFAFFISYVSLEWHFFFYVSFFLCVLNVAFFFMCRYSDKMHLLSDKINALYFNIITIIINFILLI